MRSWIALLMLLVMPLAWASEKTDAAVTSGSLWLRQLDKGEYQAAYGAAGALMREKVKFEDWQAAIHSARQSFGMVHKRELTYGALEKQLPGLARGEYAQLRFRTDFAGKLAATEHLTLMLEADGSWRAIGYFIQ